MTSHTQRLVGRVALLVAGLALAWTSSVQAATIIADYQDDFQGVSFPAGWAYQWNPVDVPITDPANFDDFIWASPRWDDDGVVPTPGGGAAGYIFLNSAGGHPGRPPTAEDSLEHYPVAAYTVSSGFLTSSITDSSIRVASSASTGVEVRVFLGSDPATPILNTVIGGGSSGAFDTTLGALTAGETIYVAVGPNGNSGHDSFGQFDFTILGVVPEPASAVVWGLGLLGLVLLAWRKRRK